MGTAVMLLATAAAEVVRGQSVPSDRESPPALGASSLPGPRVTAVLSDGSIIVGRLAGERPLALSSRWGAFELPLQSISLVQRQCGDTDATVFMTNGDRVTGQLTGGPIAIEAVWGEISLALDHIVTIETGVRVSTPRTPSRPEPAADAQPASPQPFNPLGTVEETMTGRLMISGGMNSDAGLTGQVIVDEAEWHWPELLPPWHIPSTTFRHD